MREIWEDAYFYGVGRVERFSHQRRFGARDGSAVWDDDLHDGLVCQ